MSADSYAGSVSNDDARRDETAIDPVSREDQLSREDMETSVLDALRPLLGPKRKKAGGEDALDPAPAQAANDETSARPNTTRPDISTPAEDELPHRDAAPAAEIEPATASDQDRTTDMMQTATATLAEDKALDKFVAGREIDEFETFLEIGGDLERRSRRSATMARLLDQHHAQLQTAEKERDEAYEKLARVYPVVQETARALKEAMDSRKVDPDPSRMARLFQLNGRALDELEKVAVTIFADFLWCKSAWELYAKTVGDARELRANADS